MPASGRPRILVLNQYYRPGVEATANLLADLCEALAEEYEVTVVTGRLHGRPELADSEMMNGVRVLRTRSTTYDRTKLRHRGVNYATYLADSIVRSLSIESPSLILCMTDPPIVGDLGVVLSRRYGAPLLVISEDVFPEIATELDRLTNPVLIGIFRKLVAFYLSRAAHVVAIGECMRARLIEKGAPEDRITVIPNWVDANEIRPMEHRNAWSVENDLEGKFVVMHSGNVGHAQDLDNLVRSTTFLRDLASLSVPIVGSGARIGEIRDLTDRLDADKVVFLPYQPREVLPLSLATAHIHYVGLAKGLAGFVVPSRLYGILAAGRPAVVAADPASETAQLVSEVGCGVTIPPDRPDLLARAIRAAHDGEFDLEEMGRCGREYVEREADRPVALARYRSLVASLVGAPG